MCTEVQEEGIRVRGAVLHEWHCPHAAPVSLCLLPLAPQTSELRSGFQSSALCPKLFEGRGSVLFTACSLGT